MTAKKVEIRFRVSKKEKINHQLVSEMVKLDESDCARVFYLAGITYLTDGFEHCENDIEKKIRLQERVNNLLFGHPFLKKPTISISSGADFLVNIQKQLKGGFQKNVK